MWINAVLIWIGMTLSCYVSAMDLRLSTPEIISLETADGKVDYERFVDIPLTLDAFKIWAIENQVAYTIGEHSRASSGSACAHSPLCVIVLPAILADIALNRQQYHLVEFNSGNQHFGVEYEATSGLLIRALFPDPVKMLYLKSLRRGFVFQSSDTATVFERIQALAEKQLPALAEVEQHDLAKEIYYAEVQFFNDSDAYISRYIRVPKLRGDARAVWLKPACGLVNNRRFSDFVGELMSTLDEQVLTVLSPCLERADIDPQRNHRNDFIARLLENRWQEECIRFDFSHYSSVRSFETLLDISHSYQYTRTKIPQTCSQEVHQLAKWADQGMISGEAYLRLKRMSKEVDYFLQSRSTREQRQYDAIVLAEITYAAEMEVPLDKTVIDTVVTRPEEKTVAALQDYFLVSLHEPKKEFLSGWKNLDIHRQAGLLEHVNRLPPEYKLQILNSAALANRSQWQSAHAALYIALGGIDADESVSCAWLADARSNSKIPTSALEVSSSVDESGRPLVADLVYFAMYQAGMPSETIESHVARCNSSSSGVSKWRDLMNKAKQEIQSQSR